MFNDKKTERALIITLIVCIAAEVFFFNFRFWESLAFKSINDDAYTISQYDNYIEITGINEHVDNIYIDLFDHERALDGDVVKFSLQMTDEGNIVYYPLQETEVVYGVKESSYIRIHTNGKTEKLRFQITSFDNEPFLNDLKLNVTRPFVFNFIRPAFIFALGILIIILGHRSPVYKTDKNFKDSLQRSITIFIVLANMLFISSLGLISKYNEDAIKDIHTLRQYEYIADSIVHGKTYIDVEDPPVELSETDNPYDPEERNIAVNGKSYIGDYAYFEGKYYSYFGVVPVFLFFIPYLLITGKALATAKVVLLCGILFVPCVFWFMHEFTKKFFPRTSFGMYIMMSTVLLYGSEFLYCIRIPTVYVVPIMTGLLFDVLGLTFWLKASDGKGKISKGYLIAGAVLIALVMGCRPQLALVLFLAFPMFMKDIIGKRFFTLKSMGNTMCVMVPFAVVAVFLCYYNYIRFGSPFDFGATYNLTSFDMTHRGIVLDRLPAGIFAYLLQPFYMQGKFPFFFVLNPDETPLASTYQGVIISEPFMAGFFAFNLIALFIFGYGLCKKEIRKKGLRGCFFTMIVLSFIIIFLDIQMVGMNQRYLCDFSFLLMLCAVMVILTLLEKYGGTPEGRIILTVTVALSFLLVGINWITLLCEGRYNPMFLNSPSVYYGIKYGFFAFR